MSPHNSNKVIIVSAPSGSGKTTIVKHLIKTFPTLEFSISTCTRPIRNNLEKDGVDYYFVSVEEFMKKVKGNEFIEWEEVYPGNFYGTLKSEIDRIWIMNKQVIFDVDVKGGVNLKKYFKEKALAIFVKVMDTEILKNRLTIRSTESEVSLEQRIAKSKTEQQYEKHFDVTIINDELANSLQNAEKLVSDFLKA